MKYVDRTLVRSPLYIGFCTSQKEYDAEMKRLGVEDAGSYIGSPGSGATYHTFHSPKTDRDMCIVALREDLVGKPRPGVYALLAHEAVHIWQKARNILDEQNPSSEFEAYAIQNISQELFEAYEEVRKSKKALKKKPKT